MQQTEKYQLNLIERTDPFSPEALNQNTQKVENALIAHEGLVEEVTGGLLEQTANLDARLKVVEVHHVAVGTYHCKNGAMEVVNLGFKPKCVVCAQTPGLIYFLRTDNPENSNRLTDTGFQVGPGSSSNGFAHYTYTYTYIALA